LAYDWCFSSNIWEEKKKRRWKAFNNLVCQQLEEAAIKYHMLEAAGKTPNPNFSTDKLQVSVHQIVQPTLL
jgi:hypothetical protein